MRIEYAPSAQGDLLEIGDYYYKVGGNQLARRMVKQIRSDIMALLNYTAPSYELVPGVRRLVVAGGAYLAFHRINESKSVVEVIHVRRSERVPATEKDME
jgi:plasmid stabilization system protein ParE